MIVTISTLASEYGLSIETVAALLGDSHREGETEVSEDLAREGLAIALGYADLA